MKLETASKAASGLHLTYCTNIHSGETWQQVFSNLQAYVPELKARLAPTDPFGIGLRLSEQAARELLTGGHLAQFQAWLRDRHLYVFTLNGFPYGGFHQQVVKDQVYAPDWTQRSRLTYTQQLVKILAALLPAGMDGGISTVPLSYKPWWSDQSREAALQESCLNLAKLTADLIHIEAETGKLIHIDLEPEPDGLIENAAEVIDFFHNWLLPVGGDWLAQHLAIAPELAAAQLSRYIRICYDTCHFAVEYEDPATVFDRFRDAGIQIGKIQISAALKVNLPQELESLKLIQERLQPFAESTYLHQVIERRADGSLHHYPDLEKALPQLGQGIHPSAQEWRIHFHVPLFIQDYQLIQSTQDDIVAALKALALESDCHHLEIETYTWDVLPPDMKADLLTSIQREYEWVLSTSSRIGLMQSKSMVQI